MKSALDAALKATLGILEDAGHPATDTTRQAVADHAAGPADHRHARTADRNTSAGRIRDAAGTVNRRRCGNCAAEDRHQQGITLVSRFESKGTDRGHRSGGREGRGASALNLPGRCGKPNSTRDARSSKPCGPHARRSRRPSSSSGLASRSKPRRQALDQAQTAATEASRQREAADRRAKEAERALESARRHHDAILRGKS